MGIITRNSLRSVRSSLQQFDGIKDNDFVTVITRDAAPPKPSPEGIFKAAEEMGCLATELTVVGDFRFDVIAGKRAGATTILLTNGNESTMLSEDPQPDFVCKDLEAVMEIVLGMVILP